MATAIYTNQPGAHYGYPQPPPSPPMDETSKCSLPSISNLLGLADAGSPTTEHSPQSQASSTKADTRPNSSHYAGRTNMPPTPPMSTEASFEGYSSPSTKSVSQVSVVSAPNYYYETTPPVEDVHRHQMAAAAAPRMPMHVQSYPQQAFASSYMNQPAMGSYYPPPMSAAPSAQSQISGLYYQRPLPQAFPPLPVTVSLAPSLGASPWQHHHYISPSSAASFPQSQDRYICQTCNKAFSRPSSLRIHSHSHTGEKPFKCPHAGCGKAFSVRSNMKRHERGCHNFDSASSSLH
ncbi:Uu.00g117090.m01.CDS01 [Anthostomella pinea]|uniref:Uu.00g117090.m01.CDS01 n=1 Tax=Anthostomella pinea TaxID=933095 RepID=A0AAI8VH41_9PEZI|nr:Uu.00g117090.m01.CDS01 [Anthostomella pinea]